MFVCVELFHRYVQALLTDLGVPASCCGAADVDNYVDMAARFCLDKVSAVL